MDGREGIPAFYLNNNNNNNNRGASGSGSNVGSGHVPPPGFRTQSNPNMRVASMGSSAYQIEQNQPSNFPHGITMGVAVDGTGSGSSGGGLSITTPGSGSDPIVKKKRGRPRKYRPDGSHMALALTPASTSAAASSAAGSPGSVTPTPKKNRGRPPGSGRKQRLADVGEWMSNSAGLAFTPHIIHVEIGEDIAAKVMSFAQQRPRALCVLSGNGGISSVTLRSHSPSAMPDGTVTYEGPFEILCLSGSYLLPENGSVNDRTGGLSLSAGSPDGHVIGGAIGGSLIASTLVQVVVGSFIYGSNNSKGKMKADTPLMDDRSPPGVELNESIPAVAWPQDSQGESRNTHTEIDLTRG